VWVRVRGLESTFEFSGKPVGDCSVWLRARTTLSRSTEELSILDAVAVGVVSFVAGEMKRRDLPRSLYCGSVIVMLVFLVANLSYYHALSSSEIRSSDAVAAFAVGKLAERT